MAGDVGVEVVPYEAAGDVPAVTFCEAANCEGSSGDADRATNDVSLGAASLFHQASRDVHPDMDWQPANEVIESTTTTAPKRFLRMAFGLV